MVVNHDGLQHLVSGQSGSPGKPHVLGQLSWVHDSGILGVVVAPSL